MQSNQNERQLISGKTTATFSAQGDLLTLLYDGVMVNQLIPGPLDASIMNIYLRKTINNQIMVQPLIGRDSTSTFSVADKTVRWTGKWKEIDYQVTFYLANETDWFWKVALEGSEKAEVDVIYAQDIGLADKATLQNNEAYVSQYIDHRIFERSQTGFTLCSRQNQIQSKNRFPFLQQGSFNKITGYTTDATQFYGLAYKETSQPIALSQPVLVSELYQYEMAFCALQTEKIDLTVKDEVVFYNHLVENHPLAITEPIPVETIKEIWEKSAAESVNYEEVNQETTASLIDEPLQVDTLTKAEISNLFPKRLEEEKIANNLVSFFTDRYAHVVLKEKELNMERATGHILLSGNQLSTEEPVLTTTAYMYGVFNSQVVLGNTSMNKLMSNTRNALNLVKSSGQRIYIEKNGKYQLLALPSAFEMGFNYAKWYYKLADDLITVRTVTAPDSSTIRLELTSENNEYRFIISTQITMNENEYQVPYDMQQTGKLLTFTPTKQASMAKKYPAIQYYLTIDKTEFTVHDERLLTGSLTETDYPLVLLQTDKTKIIELTIQASLTEASYQKPSKDLQEEIDQFEEFIKQTKHGFDLAHPDPAIDIERVNILSYWYTHNMLVHYLVPHGLEQFAGAAWGTRDVLQGPTEYFLATENYGGVKDILRTVFANQFQDDGNWPQWFMFDSYEELKAEESHGDIIVWPLKVMGDYLLATKDTQFLAEEIPYTDRETFGKTAVTLPVLEHLKKAITYVQNHLLEGTQLPGYGDGDWDDTLQPFDSRLKSHMASSWTVALLYQALTQLAEQLSEYDHAFSEELTVMASGLEKDYQTYMLATDVIPGFVFMEEPGQVDLMIHPSDKRTNIDYRLLPMQQSMIAELFTPEESEHHYQIIKDKLSFPDGVRLMSQPANYQGGVSQYFKRAEQAANFGREVGLHYIHAHIRFAEAMAKIGKKEEAWQALSIINPVNLKSVVPNAELRQSNAYFSSSDGDFKSRYDAANEFEKLRTGEVGVKGGWRIYSSGPGIYMNQLITNVLGIRMTADKLTVDPILPNELDGLTFTYRIFDQPVTIHYHLNVAKANIQINGQTPAWQENKNRYRTSGFVLAKAEVIQLLKASDNTIDIYMKD
ncbi:GH36-type glycosyl hydrolase domain-containing protein [Carnobacterium sp. TMP28]|uniref:GH36-type glycosyl hydrolase domain-containing protein n=1 Tax=Carnobacterium sp. TMP28 TaxID=3397060 RepID=UPI0039E0C19B